MSIKKHKNSLTTKQYFYADIGIYKCL